ncbi:hypothetical protein [Mucilaginibacter segetis]|uniref:Uncharacterized protein n=1 Tax=Mucilaginibacter segetis TaxID=2793071 RepID=A0A934PPH0_9SPHI|nr:hypothetical protein [Mucilaginibacter segetis]MBK0378319.1 hypothetical protein [Mucilaginibacter segetis]
MIGEWRIDDSSIPKTTQKVIDKLVAANPAIADQLEDNKEAIMDQIKAIRLNLKADHTYESVTQQGSTGGKWELLNNEHTIQFTKADGSMRKDSILESAPSRLKMINVDLKDTTLYVHP